MPLSSSTSMPPPLPSLTLIVATTPSLGIGLRGTLPWPPLKSDLAFFARVTKRPPPHSSTSTGVETARKKSRNAVIMGRKTWESLPAKVRPLKGRVNVVVTRDVARLDLSTGAEGQVLGVGSIEEGLRRLREIYYSNGSGDDGKGEDAGDMRTVEQQQQQGRHGCGGGEEEEEGKRMESGIQLGRVFVIGGAEIYRLALEMECCERILWTRLRREWDCDVFFPEGVLPVGGEGDEDVGVGGGGGRDVRGKWVRRSKQEMERWVGEEGVGGVKREGEVEFEVCMFEREKA